MTDRGANEAADVPPRRGLEQALRDLIPTTLAAGAAAVAVAVAVGGSTSRLHTPFAQGPAGGDAVASTPAAPVAPAGEMRVQLGPKGARRPAPAQVGLGRDLLGPALSAPQRAVGGVAASVIFGPSRSVAGIGLPDPTRPTLAGVAGVEPGAPEAVLPAQVPVPAAVPVNEAVAPVVPAAVQEGQGLQRPRRLKSPRAGRPEAEAETQTQTLIFQASSLDSSTSSPKTSTEATATEESTAEGPAKAKDKDKDKDRDAKDRDAKDRDPSQDQDRNQPAGQPDKNRQAS